ncbi:MAG: creatininase family protein [Deltaproteobacteria bacterium]|nr:creatininase family protein [Deltaproteobacteria bacterium]
MILDNVTMTEFESALSKTKTMVVPYGTVEAHGTHLPLSTDTMIIEAALKRAAKEREFFLAPALNYGVCTSTAVHPGTITISSETLRAITRDIVRGGYDKGIRRFILISGHGGGLHSSAMREAGESLTNELKGATIAALVVYDILPKEARAIGETKHDSHAGELETSLILHINEELVKGRSKEEYPHLPRPIIAKDKLKYWPGAVHGNPEKASEDKGRRLMDIMVKSIVELIDSVESFEQS